MQGLAGKAGDPRLRDALAILYDLHIKPESRNQPAKVSLVRFA